MNSEPKLNILPHMADIWQVQLSEYFAQKEELKKLLNPTERSRADRFKFPIHHDRFVIARAMLRKILNLYIGIAPHEIEFTYGNHGKPYLYPNIHHIQFNLSHSDDWAVYAITKEAEVGIDIEKIQDASSKEDVAKRFFSEQENHVLSHLSPSERLKAFYQIWVKKEAVIKLLGKGLYTALSDFSVSCDSKTEMIHAQGSEIWLQCLQVTPFFPVALATPVYINKINQRDLFLHQDIPNEH